MLWVYLALALAVGALAFYGVHRLALWAERRGWIFYREKGKVGATSNALLELDAVWKPEIHHVLEQRAIEADHEVDDESGDRPFDFPLEDVATPD